MSPRRLPLLALCLALPAAAQEAALDATVAAPGPAPEWDARAVEHLLNRAGFGAPTGEIQRWVRAGHEALLEHLLEPGEVGEDFFVDPLVFDGRMRTMDREALNRQKRQLRDENRDQARSFLGWWVGRMLRGDGPLRERMVLFWHGFFTSEATKVRLSYPMIRQNELFREHALGSYAELLRAILTDPAMLVYLDNISNRKDHPNENLARELMELFSLGEGNYTEQDVQEVARALTGYGIDRERTFHFDPREHDFGQKVVLGVEGRHDADDVVDILLDQPACARWVAQRLITYLEGAAPGEERLERYAALLREADYEIAPLLRALFSDPAFYRPEVVGARVSSPIDYLVGNCRRLGLRVHPNLIEGAAGLLGQQLFRPPNVQGWEEGEAWITTATFMNRGNLMGMLLGTVSFEDLRQETGDLLEAIALAEEAEMQGEGTMEEVAMGEVAMAEETMGEALMDDATMDEATMTGEEPESAELARERDRRSRNAALGQLLRAIEGLRYRPQIHLTARLERRGARTDRQIVDVLCDDLLAIEAPLETRRSLVAFLRRERELLGREPGELLAREPEVEHLLRRLAHLILSLPEAQLG